MRRRDLLAALPALAASRALAAGGAAAPDPLQGLVAEWRARAASFHAAPEGSAAALEALLALEARITGAVAETPAGAAAQLDFATEWLLEDYLFGACAGGEDRALFANLRAALGAFAAREAGEEPRAASPAAEPAAGREDPALAAMRAYLAALAALEAGPGDDDGPEARAWEAAFDRLASTVPETPAGALAMLPQLHGFEPRSEIWESFAEGLRRMAARPPV